MKELRLKTPYDYNELRGSLDIANANSRYEKPCREGACCNRAVTLVNDDIQFIRENIQSGVIPKHIIQRAKERASDQNSNRCPFLGDRNECEIYPYRPIVCMAFGIAGMLKNWYATQDLITGPTVQEGEVGFGNMAFWACEPCIGSFRDNKAEIPLPVVQSTARAFAVHQYSRDYLHEFVLRDFKNKENNP